MKLQVGKKVEEFSHIVRTHWCLVASLLIIWWCVRYELLGAWPEIYNESRFGWSGCKAPNPQSPFWNSQFFAISFFCGSQESNEAATLLSWKFKRGRSNDLELAAFMRWISICTQLLWHCIAIYVLLLRLNVLSYSFSRQRWNNFITNLICFWYQLAAAQKKVTEVQKNAPKPFVKPAMQDAETQVDWLLLVHFVWRAKCV